MCGVSAPAQETAGAGWAGAAAAVRHASGGIAVGAGSGVAGTAAGGVTGVPGGGMGGGAGVPGGGGTGVGCVIGTGGAKGFADDGGGAGGWAAASPAAAAQAPSDAKCTTRIETSVARPIETFAVGAHRPATPVGSVDGDAGIESRVR